MKAHHFIVSFFLVISFSLCLSDYGRVKSIGGDYSRSFITISPNRPFSQQVVNANTIYEIETIIDLGGESVMIPENVILRFRKEGKLKNGRIHGSFEINAPSRMIFENVDILQIGCPIKISWLVGNRKKLYNKDFHNLPNVQVDFERINFIADEEISLDVLAGFYFINLVLSTNYSLHYWPSALMSGDCAPMGDFNSYSGTISIEGDIPDSYIGYLIEITTADRTKYDYRPDEQGIPSLYKGITSRVTSIEGNALGIRDSLELFSKERLYNGHLIKSQYRIFAPRSFILSNCRFLFSNKSGISLRGCDFLIDNCVFESSDGSNTILSLGGHTGIVKNCTVKGAYYPETHTSYGIQVVKGTNITIEDSKFYDNRRSVDFSGGYESRFNEVRRCYFFQDNNDGKTGSAIGGHSTSFGNAFRNNIIQGDFQVGIQCRGENEIIEGNYFNCSATTMISFAYNTQIINNRVVSPSKYAVGVFAGSGIQEDGNSLHLYNNVVEVRRVLINGDSRINYIIENNTIVFKPNAASVDPVLFSQKPKDYQLKNNSVRCSRSDTKIKLATNGELLKY